MNVNKILGEGETALAFAQGSKISSADTWGGKGGRGGGGRNRYCSKIVK